MQNLTLKVQTSGATIVPNYFLDIYMAKASGEFVKVYLCLLRATSDTSTNLSVSMLADKLNHTENDILRALKYWESEHLLILTYDDYDTLCGIEFTVPDEIALQSAPVAQSRSSAPTVSAPPAKIHIPAKPSYSHDDIDKLTQNEDLSSLIYIAQSYTGKTLSSSDVNTLIYISTSLNFSAELTEYLIEYCVSLGHSSFNYMEKVAIAWAEEGITSVREAKAAAGNYYKKEYFQVLKAFGLNKRNPVEREINMINRWINEYCFDLSIILEACSRTMQSIHQPSFEYTDTILSKWHRAGIKKISDIAILDSNFSRSRENVQKSQPAKPISNKFNNMPSRSYVYDDFEKQLLNQ